MGGAPANIDRELRAKITEIRQNDKRIIIQKDQLRTKTDALNKHTKEWRSVFNSTDAKIRAVGDVQNWAELIDQEIRVLEKTVELRRQR